MMPISVTFDSNVWECIADPVKLDGSSLRTIRASIEAGRVLPFISDVVVTLEGIKRQDRASFFRDLKMISTSSEPVVQHDEGGTPHVSRTITRRPSLEHFPPIHEKLSTALHSAFALGFKMIRVPRIGWMRLDDDLYKPSLTDGQQLGELLDRTYSAAEAFEREGCGVAWVTALGEAALRTYPDLSQGGIRSPLVAFAYGDDQAAIPGALAEWADGDALAAHYGHQHDVFCSLDRGGGAGSRSVLHHSRRKWLRDEFGIQVKSPTEVAEFLT
jgi:hypothetical protein